MVIKILLLLFYYYYFIFLLYALLLVEVLVRVILVHLVGKQSISNTALFLYTIFIRNVCNESNIIKITI